VYLLLSASGKLFNRISVCLIECLVLSLKQKFCCLLQRTKVNLKEPKGESTSICARTPSAVITILYATESIRRILNITLQFLQA
jgi:hypothetical protein